MLSYQHIYHAGNLADVHKHALLAWMLDYLIAKDKPLSYIETHAGRGLYDLDDAAAQKTGEATMGVARAAALFAVDHPYRRVLDRVRADHGAQAYPGSPLVAAAFMRPDDRMHLAELHPGERTALLGTMRGTHARIHAQDGFDTAHAILPPTPRRGLMLIDPSYEVKTDYSAIPGHLARITRAWNVGIVALWYPLLRDDRHRAMIHLLSQRFPDALCHEVRFAPARHGHGMVGSGMFIIHPPYLMDQQTRLLDALFAELHAPNS